MNKARISEILKQLTAVDAPSGAERRAEELIRSLLSEQPLPGGTVAELRTDALGNLIARIPGNAAAGTGRAPGRIMIAAHMDEIGLIVTRVEQGFLHVTKVGGVDPRSVVGQEVTVYPSGPGSEALPGRPGRLRRQPSTASPVGGRAQEGHPPAAACASTSGCRRSFSTGGIVRVGDRVAIRGPHVELMDGRLATKALDNRASVAVMLGALGYLASMRHSWDVYLVGDGAGGDRACRGRPPPRSASRPTSRWRST